MRAGGTSNCHVDSQLALTVWVYRRRGILFPYRYPVRNAVRCRGRAEDKALDASNSHCREQRERPDNIVVPVDLGMLHRFGDQRLRGEVQHAVKGLVENLGDVTQLLVYELRAVDHCVAMSGRQVVEHDDVMASGDQLCA